MAFYVFLYGGVFSAAFNCDPSIGRVSSADSSLSHGTHWGGKTTKLRGSSLGGTYSGDRSVIGPIIRISYQAD